MRPLTPAPQATLPQGLELTLRRLNPWWANEPGPVLPPHRRHLVGQVQRRLRAGLAPIVVVRGARQVDVNHAPFGLLVTRDDANLTLPDDIVALPLSTLMLLR